MHRMQSQDLAHVTGGSLWSEISKVFGREGKPFLGRDLLEVAAGAGAAAAGAALGLPIAAAGALGKAAQAGTEDTIDRKNGIHTDRGPWYRRIPRS